MKTKLVLGIIGIATALIIVLQSAYIDHYTVRNGRIYDPNGDPFIGDEK